jgi:hypothetical protein
VQSVEPNSDPLEPLLRDPTITEVIGSGRGESRLPTPRVEPGMRN